MGSCNEGTLGVIGSGKIGRCWAILFAGAGYKVQLHDLSEDLLTGALSGIRESAAKLQSQGLLRGSLSPEELVANISTTTRLADALKDASYVQECVFEDYELKKEIFRKMDALVSEGQVLASSTSALPPSEFSSELRHREMCLVAHPVNPPFLCPVVELVPAPWTKQEAIDTAHSIMTKIGQAPVRLNKEVRGFAVNRLQYALAAEAWRLVGEGVMSAADVDRVVSDGLGLRWAFLGPLEVMSLNGDGILDHNRRYGRGFKAICDSYGPAPDIASPEIEELAKREIEGRIPVSAVPEWRNWRDERLAALARLKNQMGKEKPA